MLSEISEIDNKRCIKINDSLMNLNHEKYNYSLPLIALKNMSVYVKLSAKYNFDYTIIMQCTVLDRIPQNLLANSEFSYVINEYYSMDKLTDFQMTLNNYELIKYNKYIINQFTDIIKPPECLLDKLSIILKLKKNNITGTCN